MKRSGPLNRTKPLKPGGPLKRTPLKRVSEKRRKRMAEVNPVRDEYRKLFPYCQYCDCARASELHEICSGPARDEALSWRETWLYLCQVHHDLLQHAGIEINLACKLLADPEFFSLAVVNHLRGRASTAVTMADVVKHLRLR